MNDYKLLVNPWKKWFAWYPVKSVAGRKIWFKTIYRQECLYYDYNWGGTYRAGYVYAELFDILNWNLK